MMGNVVIGPGAKVFVFNCGDLYVPNLKECATLLAVGYALPPTIKATAEVIQSLRLIVDGEAQVHADGSKIFRQKLFQELGKGDFKYAVAGLVAYVYFMTGNK